MCLISEPRTRRPAAAAALVTLKPLRGGPFPCVASNDRRSSKAGSGERLKALQRVRAMLSSLSCPIDALVAAGMVKPVIEVRRWLARSLTMLSTSICAPRATPARTA